MRAELNADRDTVPAQGADLRGAERFTLMIRMAKLLCASGEFLCVIRDVSETGVRLRLFHALPGDPRMALELGNGEIYFVERVWERDGHAGFRFAAPIAVCAFIAEASPFPRRQMRLRIAFPALVTAAGVAGPVEVQDLSTQGARIVCDRFLAIGQPVRLEADKFPKIFAKVAWRSGSDYGLAFEQVFAFEALALLAADLQGLGSRGLATLQRQALAS